VADSDVLRLYLGERIPAGGTAADTFFSESEITELLDRNTSIFGAAAEGWGAKAAEFATLVDTSEAGGSEKMSQMHKQSLEMQPHYAALAAGAEEAEDGLTVIHTLERT